MNNHQLIKSKSQNPIKYHIKIDEYLSKESANNLLQLDLAKTLDANIHIKNLHVHLLAKTFKT